MLGSGGVWRGLGSIPPILMDVPLELHVSSGMVLWSVVWSIVLGVCVCVCMWVCMCVCVCVVGGGGGVTLMILGWGCTGGTLKPLVQLEFDQTPKISPYPTFAIFQKLPRSTLSLILSRVTGKSISFCECHVLVSLV